LLRNQYWFSSILGERAARYTMELGGKSAAIVLDDMETDEAMQSLTRSLCMLSGQVCAALTRVGGFKQSGIGREGGVEGLLPYLGPPPAVRS
jgi:acyl-CoA reductase-like NAD-dependent aldehyde dehydrogenase